jgi:hypothetical protein
VVLIEGLGWRFGLDELIGDQTGQLGERGVSSGGKRDVDIRDSKVGIRDFKVVAPVHRERDVGIQDSKEW